MRDTEPSKKKKRKVQDLQPLLDCQINVETSEIPQLFVTQETPEISKTKEAPEVIETEKAPEVIENNDTSEITDNNETSEMIEDNEIYNTAKTNEVQKSVPEILSELQIQLLDSTTPYKFTKHAIKEIANSNVGSPSNFTDMLEQQFGESIDTILNLLYVHSFVNRGIILMISNSRNIKTLKCFQCVLCCSTCRQKQYSIGYTDGSFHFIFSTNDPPHKCLNQMLQMH